MAKIYSIVRKLLRQERVVTWSLLLLLLLVGLSILRDFSISTDEPEQRNIGMVSLRYVAERFFPHFLENHPAVKQVATLHEFYDRDYGVIFELPLVWLEQILGLEEWRSIFLFRHLCTFLVSLTGVVAIYQLARRRFQDWRLGLLTAAMLVLTPRIFGEMFYNNKDIVFMAVFAIATNTAVRFIERPGWGRAGWHALACACAINVRVMGILIPVATLALLSLQAVRGVYRGQRQPTGPAGLYLGLLLSLTVLFWPFLWEAPLQNFKMALEHMSRARWTGEILYAGEMVVDNDLPWHYAAGWIGVTVPVLYLIGFLVGTFLTLRQLSRRRWQLYATPAEWQDLLFLGLFLAPLVAVVMKNSTLYNAWRQLYFVYPPLLLVAVRGLLALYEWQPRRPQWQRWWPRLSYTALGGTFLMVAMQLVKLHPLQTTYFNILAGAHVEGRFEIDYWVMSYQEGLKWVVAHDNRAHIIVSAQRQLELEATRKMLPPYDRDRLEVVQDTAKSNYFLTTYYGHYYPYAEYNEEMTTIHRGGQRILSVFRGKKQ